MKKNLTYILMLWVLVSQGQSLYTNYVNKKTNQYLIYSGGARGKKCNDKFYLISKANPHTDKLINVGCDNIEHFVDSLKAKGWIRKIKYVKQPKKYSTAADLASIAFIRMQDGDSLFEFVYKITLTNIKQKSTQVQYDTVSGTEKQKVLLAFVNKDYEFDEIKEQKGTSIIFVGLYSEGLYHPSRKYNYVFAPWHCYYF